MPVTTKKRFELGESSHSSIPHVRYRRGLLPFHPITHECLQHDIDLPPYSDCGDSTCVCCHCGALFWYYERVLYLSRVHNPAYTKCCKQGRVCLPVSFQPPEALLQLFANPAFMECIRAYNSMFAMTSFGAKIDESINFGRGPYTFKVSGQISHWIGCFCPPPSEPPRFLQLYMYDTENEIQNRLRFYEGESRSILQPHIVASLSHILHRYNGYVATFKTARDMSAETNLQDYAVRLYHNVPDSRYCLPATGSLGGIVYADDPNASEYDIIVHSRSGPPKRVNKLHRCYMPLQYPLLFPFGENGWSSTLQSRETPTQRATSMSVNMYYSYQIHERSGSPGLLLRGGRLFQQYLVDAYLCIEQARLDYIRNNQQDLRSDYVSGIYDALSKGESDGHSVGKRIFLPSSFVGGPRYMYSHYQDAIAICRVYGNPQYFVTFTCNVKWPEITRYMASLPNTRAQNRPDVIARVFQMKVLEFITFVKQDRTFGNIVAYLYTIEFQKRGLPHCHTLFWVASSAKITQASDIDSFVTAELPDPVLHPNLYATVTKCMIHGPCGLLNPVSMCMRDGVCTKSYPKPFSDSTFFDKDGYVHYKRADNVVHTMSNGIQIHNGFIVPYNRRLCSRFNAHINVEFCGWSMLIKYLFKYISKGADRVSFGLRLSESVPTDGDKDDDITVDEVKNFIDGRFICPHEAAWRILNFPIHQRQPAVQILAVHLENMQNTTFPDICDLHTLIEQDTFGKTTLTGWLLNNQKDPTGHDLTYVDYVGQFRWDCSSKEWVRRSRNGPLSLGRLANIHPTAGDLFYLRMLLCHQKGCKTFSDIRSIRGITYPTYQLACKALGLIGDDAEWLLAFDDACAWASANELRSLFCNLILFCDVSNPKQLWDHGWKFMCDDILHGLSTVPTNSNASFDDWVLQEATLIEIEKILRSATPSKSLSDFNLPLPSRAAIATLRNRLLLEETSYNRLSLHHQYTTMVPKLNPEQLNVYNRVINAMVSNQQILLFVYGHGGTGKTFLWSIILAHLRSIGKIVLAVAGSGIASLLLPSGRTAHSRFSIPVHIDERSVCNIKKNTQLADLITHTSLAIWDEATMTDRKCFECVDRSFRDLLDQKDIPFGGISVLLGGDFRQTLPVIQKATAADIINATLPHSPLWRYFSVYTLTYNMRLAAACDSASSFATWLLNVGNGTIGSPAQPPLPNTLLLQIPHSLLIGPSCDPVQQLIDFVYGSDMLKHPTSSQLAERAIISPRNDTTDDINSRILAMAPFPERVYYSNDSAKAHSHRVSNFPVLYPQELLNSLRFQGFPTHRLQLKPNTPIILLRNINQRMGLCNGTRLIITQLLPNVIEATIITGTSIGSRVYIPRIKFVHTRPDLPFVFIRKQFPIRICYAMTINKSQGQTLKKVGIYLPLPVFSHGQLYVALSRATSPDSIKMLILDEDGRVSNTTNNVVYTQLLRQLSNNEVTHIVYVFPINTFLFTNNICFTSNNCFSTSYTCFFCLLSYKELQMERIANLRYGSPGTALDVRVIRKWTHSLKSSETWFIVTDEYGDDIQILAEKADQNYVESKVVVSRCYRLENYTCSESADFQKMIPNPLRLNIGPASSINEIIDNDAIPRYCFHFATTQQLQQLKDNRHSFPDVIGVYRGIKDLAKTTREAYVVLNITDAESNDIAVSLWKECIQVQEKFKRADFSTITSDTVVAITNVKLYQFSAGSIRLNSTSATHVYVNPIIPETKPLLNRLQTMDDPLSTTHAPYPVITLHELSNGDHSLLSEKTFVCNAHIIKYNINNSWYNASCSCGRYIAQKGNEWFCPTDGTVPHPTFSYALSAVVEDTTNSIVAPLTDKAVTKIVGYECSKLLENSVFQNRKILPSLFEETTSIEHGFHIQLGKWSTVQRRTYIVLDLHLLQPTPQQMLPATPFLLPPPTATLSAQSSDQDTFSPPNITDNRSVRAKRELLFEETDDPHDSSTSKKRMSDK